MRKALPIISLLIMALLLASCGQTGALYAPPLAQEKSLV